MLFRFYSSVRSRFPLAPSILAVALVLFAGFFTHMLLGNAGVPSESTLEAAVQGGKERPAAPDLDGGVAWLNTDKPIALADLRGRFVLLDFWTLCCINCIHVMPDLARLEERYPGILVVIGVHSPKFDNERKTASIHKAILRYELKHPVVNDADHKLWKAYNVNSWPTFCLIDPEGNKVGYAYGEGQYDLIDKTIRALLKEYKDDPVKKKLLKFDAINFKLEAEKKPQSIYFPGKVLADVKSDHLFIADSTNHRIVITTLEGKKIAIAGCGKEGLEDGKFADARFSDPQGMCLDGDILYVADRKNHAIRALNLKDQTVKRVAGTGEQGRQRKGGAALATGLNSPWDLYLQNKRVYVAMAGHHQIWTYDPANRRVDPYAGTGEEQIRDGALKVSAFAQPSGLATDGKRLFVADSEISAIRAVALPGGTGTVSTIVGEGLFEFGDVNGKGKAVRLQHALGVVYHEGLLYVADTYNSKIKVIDPVQKTCATYLGDPPGWLKEKMFDEPGGLSIAGGKMYIADTNNHRIQIVDMKTKEQTTLRLQDVEPVRRNGAVSKEKDSK